MIYFVMPHYIATDELVELSAQAIKSLKRDNIFLISVDDGSPMDTAYLEPISDKVIRLEENSGFAKACNAGISWALKQPDCEYVGQANNDIEVFPGWLEALVEPFILFDNIGVTGLISHKERTFEGEPIETYSRNKITEGGLLDHWMQSGGLLLIPSYIWLEVGLYDEQFEIGGEEDVDLFLRIRDTYGYEIVMSAKSMFWHKEGATRWNDEVEPGFKAKNKAIEEKNYDRFAEKWGFDIRKDGLKFYENILVNDI
jgi:GT2 family glycosyltransferase